MEEKIKELKQAILNYDVEKAKKMSEEIDVAKNFSEVAKVLKTTLSEVGGRFEKGEIYLPHLIMAADAASAAFEAMKSRVSAEEMKKASLGTIVLGTVEGDLHDIGITIVEMVLKAAGFTVFSLGRNVPASAFVDKAKSTDADVIGLSSLMTVSMPNMGRVIEELQSVGMRDKVKVIVGGGPVTEEWSKEIGADGYCRDAVDAPPLLKKLLIKE